MSDESGDGSDGGRDSGGIDTPGGGPRRVVSERSVDDILESLNDASEEKADEDECEPATGASVRLEYDEPQSTRDDARVDERDADGADSDDTDDTSEESGADSSDDEVLQATDLDAPAVDDDGDSSVLEEGDDGDSTVVEEGGDSSVVEKVDGEAQESEDDASQSDAALAARIETGAVTGADVRAAEAGEGREATPDIDEIDLSLDDLEESPTSASTPSGTGGSADGPLAGSLERDEGTTDDGDGSRDDDGADGGLFGRLRTLFSR
ncbi:hypothetical protein [Natronobeatus ordinarius]|uniref:hypothetical protein n=1 Tax=Natronobeatus ordinarius TaxID=2963433 RepID=UPI0020CEB90A|nr:hypothetical protein [Natronobeatus ordinarius]